ncbi:MAG: hypothetical protein M1120_02530 [Patescibacteria group bacterium]|nr:hypothetical protein [Patescibacteria group bacterium]
MWKSLISKPVVKILLFLVIILFLLTVVILKRGQNNQAAFGKIPQPATIFSKPVEKTVGFSFVGDKTELAKIPKEAYVYKISQETKNALLNKLAPVLSFLGFSDKQEQESNSGKTMVWSGDNGSFSLKTDTGQFIFKGHSASALFGGTNTTAAVTDKLAAWNIIGPGEKTKTVYLKTVGFEQAVVDNINLADTLQILFLPTVGGLPVFGIGPAEPIISVKINLKSREITELENFMRPYDPDEKSSYPLVPVTNIINSLGPANVTIVLLKNSSGVFVSDFSKVATVKLNKVSLSYYLTSENQLFLQPVYLFTGEAFFNDGGLGSISLYVPAINQQYFAP